MSKAGRPPDTKAGLTPFARPKGPPTERHQFEDALRKGLGRAILHVQRNGAAGLEDAIFHACLTDTRYDRQVESVRSAYFYDLLQATGRPGDFLGPILGVLAGPDEDDAYQLCGLALRFACGGSEAARDALYARMEHGAGTEDTTACDEVIELDGVAGFQRVVHLHPWLADEEKCWEADCWLDDLEKRLGADEVWADLRGLGDPAVDAALEAVRKDRDQPRPAPTRQKIDIGSFESLYGNLDEVARRGIGFLRRWGRYADDSEVTLAAEALAAETDLERVRALLGVFFWRRFPLDPSPLLALAESDSEETAFYAARALEHVTHPSVRALALKLLRTDRRSYDGVYLLRSNYEDGDQELVAAACASPPSDEDLAHRLGLATLDFAEAHPGPGSTFALLPVYGWSRCSNCRRACVRDLIEANALPEAIREECLRDCDEDTRALARGEAVE